LGRGGLGDPRRGPGAGPRLLAAGRGGSLRLDGARPVAWARYRRSSPTLCPGSDVSGPRRDRLGLLGTGCQFPAAAWEVARRPRGIQGQARSGGARGSRVVGFEPSAQPSTHGTERRQLM